MIVGSVAAISRAGERRLDAHVLRRAARVDLALREAPVVPGIIRPPLWTYRERRRFALPRSFFEAFADLLHVLHLCALA